MENKARILVIEDNPVYARMLSNWLRPLGYGTVVAASAYSARKAITEGGTLFLDEVGNLPHDVQRQLLRALQERVYRPVGHTVDRECDIRVIAATNEDLARAIREGRFREDLFYRLNEFCIHVPPLRECREDILPLAEFFKERFCEEMGYEAGVFTEEAKMRMLSYRWPGNVRELRNCVRNSVLVSATEEIRVEDLGLPEPDCPDDSGLSLRDERDERRRIRDALERTGWNKSKAAELLGISRPTLYEKIDKYDIGQDTGR